jgi:hypothetical protein
MAHRCLAYVGDDDDKGPFPGRNHTRKQADCGPDNVRLGGFPGTLSITLLTSALNEDS